MAKERAGIAQAFVADVTHRLETPVQTPTQWRAELADALDDTVRHGYAGFSLIKTLTPVKRTQYAREMRRCMRRMDGEYAITRSGATITLTYHPCAD